MSQGRVAPVGSGVKWGQLSGLIAIQAAISLAWVIYNVFLPDLLKQFGFAPAFGITLLIVENFIAALMEPLTGGLSDRLRQRLGTSMPFIMAGVILTSAFFIAIPAVAILGNPESLMRWLLPIVVICWVIAMSIFRSPAISLLGKCASAPSLPQAFSLLTLTGGLVSSLKPLADRFILSFGAAFAFTVSSLGFLAAAALLRFVKIGIPNPNTSTNPENQPPIREIAPQLLLLGLLGLLLGWSMRLALGETLPQVIKLEIAGANLDLCMGAIAIALAILSLLTSRIATRIGNELAMVVGCVGAASFLGLLTTMHGAIATISSIALFLICASAAINGTVPLALTTMPKNWSGLGVGMYFGGAAAATSLFNIAFPHPAETITLPSSIAMAAIALVGTAIGIAIVSKLKYLPEGRLTP
jgi:Na+/melibiose symporter-like transporter